MCNSSQYEIVFETVMSSHHVMNVLQTDKVLKFFARRKIWSLINERHQHDRKITEWRTSVDRHLNAIEDKLRNELTTMHDATVTAINESIRKHESGEITTEEFQNAIQHHTTTYSPGSVKLSQSINPKSVESKTEMRENENKNLTGSTEDNKIRREEIKDQTGKAEFKEKHTGSAEDTKCRADLTGSDKKGTQSEIVKNSNHVTDLTGKDNEKHVSVAIETGRTEVKNSPTDFTENNQNQKHTKNVKQTGSDDDVNVGISGSEEDKEVTGSLNNYSKDKENVTSAIRAMTSITYKLEIDVSPEEVVKVIPSFGSCSLAVTEGLQETDVKIEDRYYDDTMLHPVLRYTGAIMSQDAEKAPFCDRLILGGAVVDDTGRVLLADRSRKVLLVCDADGNIVNEIALDMKPTGMSVMSDTELAICYNTSKYDLKLPSCIEVYDIKSFEQIWHFEVKGNCKNVTYRNSRFIVSCETFVKTYDRHGNAQQSIYRPNACIRYACLDDLDRIYFTDWNSNTLQCLIDNETEVYTYQHPDMLGPTSVEIDAIGNCYVVGFISNNIHLLNTDGYLVQILLSHTDGLYEPRIINFRPFSREFIVIDNSEGCQFRLFENSDVDELAKTTQTTKFVSFAE